MQKSSTIEQVEAATRHWLQHLVVAENLCPFAGQPLREGRVRFSVSLATREDELLTDLERELELLANDASIETTLLLAPELFADFVDYNQFLDLVDELLGLLELHGTFQVASFHPAYQFAGTAPEDAENYTNRSPYPMLHLLREDTLAHVISAYPDIRSIPERNIERMQAIGRERLRHLLETCYD